MAEQLNLGEISRENIRLKRIMRIGLDLGGEMDLASLLPLVITKVTEVMEADRSSLFLYDKAKRELWTLVAQGLLDTSEIRLPLTKGIAGHVASTGEVLNIADAYDSPLFDKSFDQRTGYRTRSVLCMPLHDRQGGLLGVVQVLNRKAGGAFTAEEQDFLQALSGQISVRLENAELYRRLEAVFDSVVNAISIAIDGRDPVTAGHSRRVAFYTLQIAHALHDCADGHYAGVQFTRAQMRELRYACLLHDFGKVGVPEQILQKPERLPMNLVRVIEERLLHQGTRVLLSKFKSGGDEVEGAAEASRFAGEAEFIKALNKSGFLKDEDASRLAADHAQSLVDDIEYSYLSIKRGTLTAKERAIMESHVQMTQNVLSAIPWPEDMAMVPLLAGTHHECPDGSGYPNGMKEQDIPLGGLCMAVADVYDALTSQDRPYKPAIPHEESANILRKMAAGGKLKGEIVELFLQKGLYILPEDLKQRH